MKAYYAPSTVEELAAVGALGEGSAPYFLRLEILERKEEAKKKLIKETMLASSILDEPGLLKLEPEILAPNTSPPLITPQPEAAIAIAPPGAPVKQRAAANAQDRQDTTPTAPSAKTAAQPLVTAAKSTSPAAMFPSPPDFGITLEDMDLTGFDALPSMSPKELRASAAELGMSLPFHDDEEEDDDEFNPENYSEEVDEDDEEARAPPPAQHSRPQIWYK